MDINEVDVDNQQPCGEETERILAKDMAFTEHLRSVHDCHDAVVEKLYREKKELKKENEQLREEMQEMARQLQDYRDYVGALNIHPVY